MVDMTDINFVKYSFGELEELKMRSHSFNVSNISKLAYCLDFVPKLK